MRVGALVALLGGGLASGVAQAAPAWRWDGPRTYQLEARLQLPQLAWVEPLQGAEFRVGAVELDLVLTCSPADGPGRLRCPIEAARLASVPLRPADAPAAAEIARQEAGWLADAAVELALTPDGRITDYDLVLPESTDPRIRRAQGRLTAWVRPAVGGLDLLLADGDSWLDPTPELLRLPSDQASSSKARVQTTATPTDGGLLLKSEGSGLTSGPALSVSYRARFWSEARFDPADGSLAERSWGLAAVRTAAADAGSPAGAPSYVAWGAARRLEGPPPTLAASGAAATEATPQLLADALAEAGGTVAVRAARMATHPPVGLWLGGEGGVSVRGEQALGGLSDLGLGVRLERGVWVELAGGVGTGGDPDLIDGALRQTGGSARVEAGWWGPQRMAPYAGAFGLLDFRTYGAPVDTSGTIPAIGPAFGLRFQAANRLSLGLTWRGAIDLRPVRVESELDGSRQELSGFGNRIQAAIRWRL